MEVKSGRYKMKIENYSFDDIDFNIVRDDLFPAYYGGNKARKMTYLESYLLKEKYDAIVTTGGIQSNHCRVVALFAAKHQFKCTLILHGSEEDFYSQKGNALLMRMSGCEIQFVNPTSISETMDKAMVSHINAGNKPYYYYGGGHNYFGVMSYKEALVDLATKIDEPDHIFLASGTGSTQAGIILGLKEVGWNEAIVHGISVARSKTRGIQGVLEAARFVNPSFEDEIIFHDQYVMGGYGAHSEVLPGFIEKIAQNTGLILDTTYTGKAMYGMLDYIKKYNIKGRIVFWNTGGLPSCLS